MFCMLLRKRLGNGKLLAIRQDGLERVLYFDFSCVNELGDIVQLTLAIEIMGRYSNLILIDETGKVIDSMKRVDATMSSKRLVLPGLPYEMPPRDERLNFLQAAPEQMLAVLSTKTGELSKALLQTFEGVSPVLVREWAYYTGKGQPCRAESLTDDQKDRLCYTIGRTREILEQGEAVYTIVSTREGQPKDFSFLPLHQYGTLMVTKVMPSACALLDEFFASRDHMARLKQRANDLFHLLLHATERIQRRIVSQSEELEACGEKDTDRRKADLISANLYRLHKGDTEAVLEDFYEPDCPTVHIALDARLTPPQNAQKYYQAYKKACTAEKILTEQIAKGREELTYLDSVLDALSRAETENDLEQLRSELAEQGYLRLLRRKGKPPKSLPPMEFTASDGTRILVGRNNRQNDQLTLKTANKNDIWLHTQNIPGSHGMNWDVVKQLVAYGREQEKLHNKNFRFTLTTNGVLLNDEVMEFCNKEMGNVVLSIDGRKEVHDHMRPFRKGAGSYDLIVPKFQKFAELRHQDKYYVRGTFTHYNTDFAADVLHLADLGFKQISVEPVVAPPTEDYAIREEDLPVIFEQYDILAREMIKREKEGRGFNFFHFMIDLTGGPCVYKRLSGCGSGTEYLAVTPWGDFYPCHQFVGQEDFCLGNVYEGVKKTETVNEFKKCNVYSKKECSQCFARFYCSGGCAANSYNFTGKINDVYEIGCKMQQKRIECALMIKAALAED